MSSIFKIVADRGFARGFVRGFVRGVIEGGMSVLRGMLETMLRNGMPVERISEVLDLSVEDIERILSGEIQTDPDEMRRIVNQFLPNPV